MKTSATKREGPKSHLQHLKDLSGKARIVLWLFLCFHGNWLVPTPGKMADFHIAWPRVAVSLKLELLVLLPQLAVGLCGHTSYIHTSHVPSVRRAIMLCTRVLSLMLSCILQGYRNDLAYFQWLRAPCQHNSPDILRFHCDPQAPNTVFLLMVFRGKVCLVLWTKRILVFLSCICNKECKIAYHWY